MSDSQGAVDSMTVLDGWVHGSVVLVVTWVAHVVGAEAAEKSRGAAVHTLPIDLVSTVLVAISCSSTDLLE